MPPPKMLSQTQIDQIRSTVDATRSPGQWRYGAKALAYQYGCSVTTIVSVVGRDGNYGSIPRRKRTQRRAGETTG